ncbi:Protein-lysine N-methyltransferase EEF2KMT [Linum grandiflorum]
MELDPNSPPGQHLVAAFLAMEPSDCLISIARECGGGLVSEQVQTFIWENCINQAAAIGNEPYLKKFVKKLIVEIESTHGNVLDELYEQYGCYMTSLKEESLRACKHISFLFPDGSTELSSCPESRKLVIPLNCSLNMLEGDTGCSVWPSSLYLSEFILSFPKRFSGKSCFEVGSGVGLVGICLSHVKASKVVLTDGDLSTLANMKLNLESNHIATTPSKRPQDRNLVSLVISNRQINIWVKCIHLPWESAAETELQSFTPDIVLGADVIYDPSCIPHLVRVLANLLKNGAVGYIASVIRNVDTFNCFLDVAEKAELVVSDVTDGVRPLELLPYMNSYRQNGVRLFTVTSKC